MQQVLVWIATLAIWVFVITSAASMGLSLTTRELVAPFRKKKLLAASLIANFLIVPLLALFILRILPLEPGLAAGLLIVATAAGAPSLPKTMEIIGADIPYAVELTLLLVLVTVVYMPLVLPLLLSGIYVDQAATALYLVVFLLLPLAACLIVKARRPDIAERLLPRTDLVANISILFIFVPYLIGIISSDFTTRAGAALGIGGLAVAILFVLGAFGIGYALGGPDIKDREVLAFATGFRNMSAALIVITANPADQQAAFMVLSMAMIGILVMIVLGGLLYRKNRKLDHSGKTGELLP